ncbi:Cobalt-precorrin-2 C20-methyltransferase [Richelia intracellularis HH01]|jgi:precorrin-2/cobalt-factor-2 C20-methyltransferase|uniref:Cobalt-precorrin-2 C20-methyltransferase n=1 Tax=Richelia intracellularis HH01 TaxID=1165094 RepID=M1WYD1_9NOST|nr:precorrin-2 C(20)-methyltransferase [Richelia intracellularis]CCH66787.1 Cobalt-precorrin-2 C20-methyltransferase [Richelia intracellularis HH01]
MSYRTGHLYGLGIGPGDPELLTLKALRILKSVPVIAYPISAEKRSLAYSIVEQYLRGNQIEVPILLPFKLTESSQPYYDKAANKLVAYLSQGKSVAILCEGNPFFFGTFIYLYIRLADKFPTTVVPGVSSIMASASALGIPLSCSNDIFLVLSAILPPEVLASRLALADAAVIIKIGRHFCKVCNVLQQLRLMEKAKFIEYATMSSQKIIPIKEVNPDNVPYFSMILIPSHTVFS